MKTTRFVPLLLTSLLAAGVSRAADRFTLTVTNDLAIARPAETIVIPFAEVKSRLPGIRFDQIAVTDASGQLVPAEMTSYKHVHKGPPHYDDLIFQHDFAAGEKSATFTVALSDKPIPPFPQKANVRYIPERYDDVAWENDKVGHRIYGPGLELPTATKDQATCSGLDVWCKRVPYMIVDHWYHKGHDGLHTDTGEGLDMYDVNTYRGCGGTGVWDGKELHVSRNWRTEMVYANGPVRAIFELGYEPWDGGVNGALDNGFMVSEKKRFFVDGGHNLDLIESTFDFKGSRNKNDGEITVAIGLTKHARVKFTPAQSESGPCPWISVWEEYPDPADGNLGTGIVLAPGTHFAGILETAHDRLILVKAKSGEPVRYYAGAGWNKSGEFASSADWTAYLSACAQRLASPVKVSLPAL